MIKLLIYIGNESKLNWNYIVYKPFESHNNKFKVVEVWYGDDIKHILSRKVESRMTDDAMMVLINSKNYIDVPNISGDIELSFRTFIADNPEHFI